MKVLICNPDKNEATQIESLINDFSSKAHIPLKTYIFLNPVDVAASSIRFDIAIIEVGMDDISGITLGKILTKAIPYIKLLYTSTQTKSLDDSFDVLAVRYYKKPYSRARFYSGLKEAIKRIDNETICFDIKEEDTSVRICKNDIIYIEIKERKTNIITTDGVYYSKRPMKFWKEHLHSSKFLVPHNSFIVNIDYIYKYKRNQFIVMSNNDTISIARAKSMDFHNRYTAYNDMML